MDLMSMASRSVRVLLYSWFIVIETNTWAHGDIAFLFECSTRYVASERSERVRNRVERILMTRRSRLNSRFKKRTCCH